MDDGREVAERPTRHAQRKADPVGMMPTKQAEGLKGRPPTLANANPDTQADVDGLAGDDDGEACESLP